MTDVREIAHRDAQEIKQLSELAKQFIVELNGEQEQFQIEEVELSDDGQKWYVTVSYFQNYNSPNQLQKTLGLLGRRMYKRISIQKNGLKVIGMSDWNSSVREAA